mmetsp:Transcript_71538/g.220832  ORF Transcript_71538/g.220832 Transcript_71538/m.220832 type:complete len:630 (-) Transcript_71538:125-2014(-)
MTPDTSVVPSAMGQRSGTMGAKPYEVKRCKPMERVAYLAPGASELRDCLSGAMPPLPKGSVRVVCISDTHNEHEGLSLPAGDLLVHSGDCLTESGDRYVVRKQGVIKMVKPEGEFLFRYFAEWFGRQRFPFKVLVAGNHDLVLQGLGKAKIQQILDESTVHGRAFYLEHEDALVGGLRIFGSPFGHWGSHNNAFLIRRGLDYNDVPDGVDVFVTHTPAILPGEDGENRTKDPLTSTLHRVGAHLHVSGHCHWAHGVYHAHGSSGRSVPCVVASVCDSHWLGGPAGGAHRLASVEGVRGDPADRECGGYNLVQPSIVCDLCLPGGRPAELAEDPEATLAAAAAPAPAVAPEAAAPAAADAEEAGEAIAPAKPALLFFGPPNDPSFVENVLPRCRCLFSVDLVSTTAEGLKAASGRSYAACVAKLGTAGNLCYPVLEALGSSQGSAPFLAIHSQTAAEKPKLRQRLEQDMGVRLFVQPGEEDVLVEALATVAKKQAEEVHPSAPEKPALLFFGPPNDPDFVQSVLPRCEGLFNVDFVEETAEGLQAAAGRTYAACVAKLGTAGNLSYPILEALRKAQGSGPFLAVHSLTAAQKPSMRQRLEGELGVNFFAKPGEEDALMEALAAVARRQAP